MAFAGCGKQPASSAAAPTAAKAGPGPGFESVEQKVSYGLGYNMGANLSKQPNLTLDRDALRAGLEDGLGGAKTRIAEADIVAAFTVMQQRMNAANAAAGQKQLTEGKAYLEKNRARPGVKVTPSGLQYEVLTKGIGTKPKATDTVEVNYHGTLIDGTVFDSSIERGHTATFAVGSVIPGWIEALQMMSVGDKWKLTIPPELAYGTHANGKIPPNAVLVFELQLVAIK